MHVSGASCADVAFPFAGTGASLVNIVPMKLRDPRASKTCLEDYCSPMGPLSGTDPDIDEPEREGLHERFGSVGLLREVNLPCCRNLSLTLSCSY